MNEILLNHPQQNLTPQRVDELLACHPTNLTHIRRETIALIFQGIPGIGKQSLLSVIPDCLGVSPKDTFLLDTNSFTAGTTPDEQRQELARLQQWAGGMLSGLRQRLWRRPTLLIPNLTHLDHTNQYYVRQACRRLAVEHPRGLRLAATTNRPTRFLQMFDEDPNVNQELHAVTHRLTTTLDTSLLKPDHTGIQWIDYNISHRNYKFGPRSVIDDIVTHLKTSIYPLSQRSCLPQALEAAARLGSFNEVDLLRILPQIPAQTTPITLDMQLAGVTHWQGESNYRLDPVLNRLIKMTQN